ncbi:Ig-like domain-containing protein [Clostridium oryzae]|uniref:Bacterial Ig-like domain protein n=1 Tax=Clostridium oryzae TaxID=1450648 RepID=A0A1V4IYE9_9CLOT|nr:Ig-like domain-containing protein [Clostridium oryzae]OPJ65071.1 bacterial Ig-like domain protein [Clostridium oryzae]
MYRVKKIIIYFVSIMLIFMQLPVITYAASNKKMKLTSNRNIQARGMDFSSNNLMLTVGGEKGKLYAIVLPDNATNKNVTWTSSNTAVATIDSDGTVTPVSEGVAIISATTVVGGYKDYCIVNVNKAPIVDVTGIKLDKNTARLTVGESIALKAAIEPKNATVQQVRWTSGDEKVAKVDDNGNVTGVSAGMTTILARSADGKYIDLCYIDVREKIDSVNLSKSSLSMKVGDKPVIIGATVAPSTVKNKKVIWKSSNPMAACVDTDGKVYAVSKGTTTITATSDEDDSKQGSCSVEVTDATNSGSDTGVTGITVSPDRKEMYVGDKLTLTASITPENASNKTVTWLSSDASIAKVDDAGNVTAVAKGLAYIIARSADGYHAGFCIVNISEKPIVKVTGVKLSSNQTTITVGDKTSLTASVQPENATDKSVKWSSSDKKILKVNSKGEITGVSIGNAAVVAISKDGNFLDCCFVKVIEKIDSIILDKSSLSFKVGDAPVKLNAAVNPANVKIKDVVWKSSNPIAAYVEPNGVVHPVSAGSTVITATSVEDSTKVANCIVNVSDEHEKSVESVTLDKSTASMNVGDKLSLTPTIKPADAINKNVTWSSSNDAIAKVDSSGNVTAIAKGIAYIIVKTVDSERVAFCIINVNEAPIIKVNSVNLDSNNVTLREGETKTIKAEVVPEKSTVKDIVWSSGDERIAKVDNKGLITAVSTGITAIVARSVDGNHIAICYVNVIEKIDSVSVNPAAVTMKFGDKSVKLEAVFNPSTINNKSVLWTSSNPYVVSVDYDGRLRTEGVGTSTVTATSREDSTKVGSCTVTVIGDGQITPDKPDNSVKGVTISQNNVTLNIGEKAALSANVVPSNAENKQLKWSSTNEAVASVDSNGNVTALSKGYTYVLVKSVDGDHGAFCLVNVNQVAATGITISKTSTRIKVGDSDTIAAQVQPVTASNKNISWQSGDNSIAKIDEKGVITAVSPGMTTIVARAIDGNYIAFCYVTVYENIDSITLDKSNLQLDVKDPSVKLNATVNPSSVIDKKVKWTSSNPMVACVDSDGVVTPVSGGSVTITAASEEDPTKTATCSVQVIVSPTDVIITPSKP